MNLDNIRKELRTATAVPQTALRAAVGHADLLAPEMFALTDKLGGGVYLVLAIQQPVRSTKVGRNESCPGGSGKKFKKCRGGATKVH